MSRIKIGVVTAYFPKISMIEVELSYALFVGERIIIGDRGTKIEYLQIEHDRVTSAQAGELVGIKIDFPVKIGDEVCK